MKNNTRRIVTSDTAFDYARLEETISKLCLRYKFLKNNVIGKSYLGRNINLLTLGAGPHKVIYVGSHHGMEWMTSLVLMRFVENYCEHYAADVKFCGYDLDYLFDSRTIYIVPMLNPDGVDLAINGIEENNPIKERLIAMNNESEDFSHWQANAKGVDLNHNYNAEWELLRTHEEELGITGPAPTRYGGEYPESESETYSLTSFIRGEENIRLLIALHTQGEEIYWTYNDIVPPNAKETAKALSKSTGYKLCVPPEKIASYGGCKDWFISEYNRPAFTFECGQGENPLPITDFTKIYGYVEESLVLAAVL